jgi:hypothetical protein
LDERTLWNALLPFHPLAHQDSPAERETASVKEDFTTVAATKERVLPITHADRLTHAIYNTFDNALFYVRMRNLT